MRAATKIPEVIKQLYPAQISKRARSISTPSKLGNKSENVALMAPANSESIAAFDKPRLPPVMGPLILLSLYEMTSGGNGDDK